MSAWEQIYDVFDPERPVVDHPAWRVDRTKGPARQVSRLLDLRVGTPRVLLTGTVGSGKSTELHRIAEARSQVEFVVLLDLDRHFTDVVGDPAALQRVASWEVCFLVGLALVRAAEEVLDLSFDGRKKELSEAWSKAARASHTTDSPELDVGALARSMVVFASSVVGAAVGATTGVGVAAVGLSALGAVKEAGGGFKWRLPISLARKTLPDQDEHLQNLLGVVNRILGEIQQAHRPVLLVIDGLDRIKDVAHARLLFVESEVLARLACRLVVCGPYALRHRPELAQVRGGFRPVTLVNEPVVDQAKPWVHGPGVRVFRELFHRRTDEIAPTLQLDAVVDRLAWYSGGRARDFVRLVRMLAEQALLDGTETPGETQVAAVLDEARRLRETGLNRHHIKVLNEVVADPRRELPEDAAAWDLLQWDCLLPYPNNSEWFFPHPLLTMNVVRPWPPAGTSA
jgi:hypothetical protein